MPALTEALKKPVGVVAAADALRKIDPEGSSAVALQGLIDALKATNPGVCIQAAEALGKLGPEAKAAVPALQEMAKDPKRPELHAPATAALQKIEGHP